MAGSESELESELKTCPQGSSLSSWKRCSSFWGWHAGNAEVDQGARVLRCWGYQQFGARGPVWVLGASGCRGCWGCLGYKGCTQYPVWTTVPQLVVNRKSQVTEVLQQFGLHQLGRSRGVPKTFGRAKRAWKRATVTKDAANGPGSDRVWHPH